MLQVISYHYVRNLPATRFPRLHAMLTADFRRQVDALTARYELATLESALAYLTGRYEPDRDLCLLTFDDGLRDHYADVFPILAGAGVQGVFFLITGCLEGRVAAVHKSHFLMAHLGVAEYQRRVHVALAAAGVPAPCSGPAVARACYRWDTPEVAELKYLLNFVLPSSVRDTVLDQLSVECFGNDAGFARELYLTWAEAAEMQAAGMVMGGHTHTHPPLATLGPADQRSELETSTAMLHARLLEQPLWPFAYPYGKRESFDTATVELLHQLRYACGFTTEIGGNTPGGDRLRIRRVDPKDVPS